MPLSTFQGTLQSSRMCPATPEESDMMDLNLDDILVYSVLTSNKHYKNRNGRLSALRHSLTLLLELLVLFLHQYTVNIIAGH